MGNEWTRLAVITYVKDIAGYERRVDGLIERGEAARQRMDGMKAIRYDRDGSPAGWSAPLAAAIDELDRIADAIGAEVALWAERAEEAHRIFDATEEATIVWEHWGKRMRWADVAHRHCYNRDHVRRVAARGIEIIWHQMPEDYRRSPYPAVPWSVK